MKNLREKEAMDVTAGFLNLFVKVQDPEKLAILMAATQTPEFAEQTKDMSPQEVLELINEIIETASEGEEDDE
ncbi:hypothetical protein [Sutcliffiella horikoshii]|uniref:hypothetical protein n=1 Tax=Sutcliffiella horikoshii TaxID=79883 RepID=UPI00384C754D